MTIEHKYINGLEVKADAREIVGYGLTFEKAAKHDSYGDIIAKGASLDSITRHESGEYKVKFFDAHDRVVGPILAMKEDRKGLKITAKVSATKQGDEILTLIADGAIDSMSIGFSIDNYETDVEYDPKSLTPWGAPVRILKRINLREVSAVAIPANIYAKILEVRSARASSWQEQADLARLEREVVEQLQKTARSLAQFNARLRGA